MKAIEIYSSLLSALEAARETAAAEEVTDAVSAAVEELNRAGDKTWVLIHRAAMWMCK